LRKARVGGNASAALVALKFGTADGLSAA